jgi:hypothetical protein
VKRYKRETEPLPATEKRLAQHANYTSELLQWLLLFNLSILALVIISFFMGCAGQDNLWLPQRNTRWNSKWHPLLVEWDRKQFDKHNPSVEMAMDMFPCEMLQEYDGTNPDPDITVELINGEQRRCGEYGMVEELEGAQGFANFCGDTAEVWLNANTVGLSTTQTYLIIAHELGHTVGLAHDGPTGGFCPSIMRPNPMVHTQAIVEGRCLPTLTVQDFRALEQKFCPL